MKVKSVKCIVGVFLLSGLIFPTLSMGDISTGSWYLDQSGSFADGTIFGQVTIEADSTAGTVTFTVVPFQLQSLYGELTNFGIDKFGFNYQNIASAPQKWGLDLSSGWKQTSDQTLSGFGDFMVMEKGVGNSRQDPLIFTLTLPTPSEAVVSNFAVLSTGNASEGNVLFAAHAAGFENDPTSHYMGGSTLVVPVSASVLLGGIGLGLVAWRKHRCG
jgi:hypothetical protein